MKTLHPADRRLHSNFGWLDSRHTFSFGEHYDPARLGFRALRVINDDRVVPGAGFGTHPHRDMEIVSYVLEGALEHRDSMGTGSVIRPGDVQRMSAGTGVLHSEFNASKVEPVHFLQIWILPERKGIEPGYEQKSFPESERQGRLRLVASRDGRDGSLVVHQDVSLYAGLLDGDETTALELKPGRHAFVHVARGSVTLNGEAMNEGDGVALSDTTRLELAQGKNAELLVFDLA